MPQVKVELHTHTNDDPQDAVRHSARELVDRACALGYGALAITLHDRLLDDERTAAYAEARGLLLVRGIERTIERRHVLLVNFSNDASRVDSFDDLYRLKAAEPRGLVVAPHPWYPVGHSLGARLVARHADLWDAIEINAFYTLLVDFNRSAWSWAAELEKPLVGNGDVHQLEQLGTTSSIVEVEGAITADGICDAIRYGRVRVDSVPLSTVAAVRIARRALLSRITRRAW